MNFFRAPGGNDDHHGAEDVSWTLDDIERLDVWEPIMPHVDIILLFLVLILSYSCGGTGGGEFRGGYRLNRYPSRELFQPPYTTRLSQLSLGFLDSRGTHDGL